MYANTTNGHRPHVSKNKQTKVIQQLYFQATGALVGLIIQDEETTTEEWYGLSYSDANSVCTASETSVLNGVTRQYLGGATLSYNVLLGGWTRVPSCWGTKVTSTLQRMGNTNLYQVTKTTTVYTVRNAGENTSLTLE